MFFTARIERPPLYRGGSASKKNGLPAPSHHSEGARSGSKESFSYPCARIRRHKHEDFETLVRMILHAMFFSGRRQRPLPGSQYLLV